MAEGATMLEIMGEGELESKFGGALKRDEGVFKAKKKEMSHRRRYWRGPQA